MEKSGEKRTRNRLRDRSKGPNSRSNSQRVELVIARIFSKQREFAKHRSIRSLHLQDVATDEA
jgi:hypothetical protein